MQVPFSLGTRFKKRSKERNEILQLFYSFKEQERETTSSSPRQLTVHRQTRWVVFFELGNSFLCLIKQERTTEAVDLIQQ